MAGIEPASERFDPRNSTSVACRTLSRVITEISAGRVLYDHLLVFRTFSRVMCGTLTIVSPDPSPGGGRCRRTWRP